MLSGLSKAVSSSGAALRGLILSAASSYRHTGLPAPLYQHGMMVTRGFLSPSKPCSMPLDDFRDLIPRQTRMSEPVGRSWSVQELRRKSYADMHKLWLVLYKERNMLMTEQWLSKRKMITFPQPERLKKVQKSMGAIRHVLGERKREKLRIFAAEKQRQLEEPVNEAATAESVDGSNQKEG